MAADAKAVVLFVCEHGAAKSVLAATYFNQLAMQRGLPIRGIARGTAPDQQLPPAVVQGLAQAGLQPCVLVPIPLRNQDLEAAARIVTFDQPAVAARAPVRIPHHAWDGLPAVSAGFDRAAEVIVARVDTLVSALAQPD